MKIAKILYLPITVVASCLLGLNNSVVYTNNINDEAVEVDADSIADRVVDYNYIAMNNYNFEVISGENMKINVLPKSATWFDTEKVPYGAIDDFLGPQDNDGVTGTIQSVTWTSQANTYITFTLGGGPNDNRVELYKVGNDTPIKIFNSTDMGNTKYMMMPRMYKIEEAGNYYLKLIDNDTTHDFASVIFGGLCVNQTAEDAKQMIELWKLGRRWPNYDANKWYDNIDGTTYNKIFEQLNNNNEFNDAKIASFDESYFNEDFEDADWLLDWTLDYSYANSKTEPSSTFGNDVCLGYHWSDARSDAATHAIENMPYNKTGNLYFKGFYEDEKGFIAGNQYKYRIISKAFVLNSDLISVKLSGNGAQLQIIDAESLDVLGTIENSAFNSTGDTKNIASSGFNSITMTRYVANVSGLKGRTVRLGMVDSKDDKAGGDWQAINVDEIVTNHDLNSFKFDVDTFDQTNTDGLTTHGQITDNYVTISDSTENSISYVEEAYNFLQTYYTTLRSKENGINFCEKQTSDDVKNLLNDFNSLSNNAANIVNRSTDYNHGNGNAGTDWYIKTVQTFPVWQTIDYLMKLNSIDNQHSYNPYNNVLLNNSNNNTIIITSVIVIAMTALSIGGFILLKKKRMKKQ